MDNPDWEALKDLVEQYGCGPVKFYTEEGDEFIVVDVEYNQETDEIIVGIE